MNHSHPIPIPRVSAAERAIVAFIIVTATLCVALISAYLFMFDARGLLQ